MPAGKRRRVAILGRKCKPARPPGPTFSPPAAVTAGDKVRPKRHNALPVIAFQDPIPAETGGDIVSQLQALGWVDHTAIAVLLVFFVLGLFKGLIWQVSRIGILVVAYFVAGRFGHDVAGMFSSKPPAQMAAEAMAERGLADGEATLYLAYVLLFLAVVIVLSLVAMLIKKLADKAGLSFFDRLGGGVLGVATGACVVLALVFVVEMFFPESKLAQAAESSHSMRFSQQAIDWLDSMVNDDLRTVLSLPPLDQSQGGGSEGGRGVAPLPGGQGTISPDKLPPGVGTVPDAPQPGTPQPGTPQPGTPQPRSPGGDGGK